MYLWQLTQMVYSHEAAHHLFGVLWASGVCKADERAVDGDPGTPLQLKHKHTDYNDGLPSHETPDALPVNSVHLGQFTDTFGGLSLP